MGLAMSVNLTGICQTSRLRHSLLITCGIPAFIILSVLGVIVTSWPVFAQTGNFQTIGCYYNRNDNRIWLAAIGLTAKATDQDFYDDDSFMVILRAGDYKQTIDGKDVIVKVMRGFNYKAAEQYKLVKYSLVIDYSASIPEEVRNKVVGSLTDFVNLLPFAVEGQVIRFSNNVEKFPFTTNKMELIDELKKPIAYGSTALHDALMEGAQSLVQQGSSTPVRIIVLFTDGYDNSSTTFKDRTNFIASFTNLVKTERIAVLAVGVTVAQDKDLLHAITDISRGVSGAYVAVDDFKSFDNAFKQVGFLMQNLVIFRLPKLGPDKANAEISLITKSKTGSISTFEVLNCQY
jgi:hypothetical protein